ncbi:DMT family transporter [Amaricoccus macauensis]|uniref:DMT family transporter n=1 Tax=Amaricoccus macauensis TaxID=57001 RepID=UPI003C7A526E
MSRPSTDPARGITLKILSVLFFTLMAICIKAASARVPPGETVFFRSVFALPVTIIWLAMQGHLQHAFDTRHPFGHVSRGLVGTAGMALNFTALGLLPLPEATALFYTAPLFAVLFAAVILGERIRIFRISALCVGLAGAVVVLLPRMSLSQLQGPEQMAAFGALAAIAGAFFAGLAQTFTRRLTATEHTGTIVIYFTITSACLSLLTIPFGWVMPTLFEAVCLIGAGVFGGVGQILLTQAYRNAPMSVVAPFDYLSLVFSIIFGYMLFSELPTLPMLAGSSLIIVSGLFIIWREHKLRTSKARRNVK